MGWPFSSKKKKYRDYKLTRLQKIGNYKPTNWVLIEPDGKYHYGFVDAGLLNFPTHNYEIWYSPTLNKEVITLESTNEIKIMISLSDGPNNPWARLFGYEISGPLIFKSEFPFSSSDIGILEYLVS